HLIPERNCAGAAAVWIGAVSRLGSIGIIADILNLCKIIFVKGESLSVTLRRRQPPSDDPSDEIGSRRPGCRTSASGPRSGVRIRSARRDARGDSLAPAPPDVVLEAQPPATAPPRWR